MLQSLAILIYLLLTVIHIHQVIHTPYANNPTTSPLLITDDSYSFDQMDDNHNRKRSRDENEESDDEGILVINDKEEDDECEE